MSDMTTKTARKKVVEYIEQVYNNKSDYPIQYYFLWEKDGVYRFRVNVREPQSWHVIKSWFLRVDSKNNWRVQHVED